MDLRCARLNARDVRLISASERDESSAAASLAPGRRRATPRNFQVSTENAMPGSFPRSLNAIRQAGFGRTRAFAVSMESKAPRTRPRACRKRDFQCDTPRTVPKTLNFNEQAIHMPGRSFDGIFRSFCGGARRRKQRSATRRNSPRRRSAKAFDRFEEDFFREGTRSSSRILGSRRNSGCRHHESRKGALRIAAAESEGLKRLHISGRFRPTGGTRAR